MAPSDCTCQAACSACGPSGTGCACPKGKCNCAECPNKAHTEKGISDGCGCMSSGKPCTCS
ncbi:hypothetical protein CPC08DRAFT_645502 [Agrocybe pediades]|nr:hypothetical protein CPC08DRAFT_645502 [Agrocybe pediades]